MSTAVRIKRPGVLREFYVEALAAAAANWLLVVIQMPLMLPPAPMKSVAEARATNAYSNVYSIKSWPCSSFQRLRRYVISIRS